MVKIRCSALIVYAFRCVRRTSIDAFQNAMHLRAVQAHPVDVLASNMHCPSGQTVQDTASFRTQRLPCPRFRTRRKDH